MGSIRMRRSVGIAPGVRLTLSKSGLGISFGGPGLRYTIGPTGRRTRTIGLPGTGISYVETISGGTRQSRRRPGPSASPSPAAPPPRVDPASQVPGAGLFASRLERDYRAAILAHLAGDPAVTLAAFETVLAADPTLGGAHFFAGVAANALDQSARGIPHLEAIVTGAAELPDRFLLKFLPADRMTAEIGVEVAEGVMATTELGHGAVVLILAELYQDVGRLDDAIGLIQDLHHSTPDDPVARLSLADLLLADRDHDAVVTLTDGLANDDDVSCATLSIRAQALCASGHPDAGFEVFRAALAVRADRDPALIRLVRYRRALAYEAAGRHARAKADLERLLAEDAGFRDVRKRLEEGATGT